MSWKCRTRRSSLRWALAARSAVRPSCCLAAIAPARVRLSSNLASAVAYPGSVEERDRMNSLTRAAISNFLRTAVFILLSFLAAPAGLPVGSQAAWSYREPLGRHPDCRPTHMALARTGPIQRLRWARGLSRIVQLAYRRANLLASKEKIAIRVTKGLGRTAAPRWGRVGRRDSSVMICSSPGASVASSVEDSRDNPRWRSRSLQTVSFAAEVMMRAGSLVGRRVDGGTGARRAVGRVLCRLAVRVRAAWWPVDEGLRRGTPSVASEVVRRGSV